MPPPPVRAWIGRRLTGMRLPRAARGDAAAMPTVFVVGDSISMQYGPHLARFLGAAGIGYARKEGDAGAHVLDNPMGANGGDSGMVRAYLAARCAEPGFRPDLLVVNCGLHDIKRARPDGRAQVGLDDYRAHLAAIADLVAGIDAGLVWVRTTPVVEAIHNPRSAFDRRAADVAAYNAAADAVLAGRAALAIDLHAFTAAFGDAAYCDHVHFTEEVRALQGAFIAGHLLAHLSRG